MDYKTGARFDSVLGRRQEKMGFIFQHAYQGTALD